MSNFVNTMKKAFFSPYFLTRSAGQKTAYLAVLTALSVVTNMFLEYKMLDIQFSLTILVSVSIGLFAGPLSGFLVCFMGDFIGFMINSWGMFYMPWVGLSTACFSLVSGVIMYSIKWKFKGAIYVKLAIIMLLTFFLCSIGINSTGFYYFNKINGFSTAVIEYVDKTFGTGVSYIGYVFYRMFFKGQIFNSLFNYGLMFILIPLFTKIKALRVNMPSHITETANKEVASGNEKDK